MQVTPFLSSTILCILCRVPLVDVISHNSWKMVSSLQCMGLTNTFRRNTIPSSLGVLISGIYLEYIKPCMASLGCYS